MVTLAIVYACLVGIAWIWIHDAGDHPAATFAVALVAPLALAYAVVSAAVVVLVGIHSMLAWAALVAVVHALSPRKGEP